ncbi:MAG: hypothetical protein KAS51_02635 [Candidatus Omnitrophica bacterium]|nr:hypothetical protein [Candidatus Omnitrophota bacterium]
MKNIVSEQKMENLYRLAGKGLWNLQYVEEVLSFYLVLKIDIKCPGVVSQENYKKILGKYKKKTLGQVLAIAENNKLFPEEILKKLKEFKENRNWLVHNSLYTHREYLFDKITMNTLKGKLSEFSAQALKLQEIIAKELERFVISKGISKEEIDNKQKEIWERKMIISNE